MKFKHWLSSKNEISYLLEHAYPKIRGFLASELQMCKEPEQQVVY